MSIRTHFALNAALTSAALAYEEFIALSAFKSDDVIKSALAKIQTQHTIVHKLAPALEKLNAQLGSDESSYELVKARVAQLKSDRVDIINHKRAMREEADSFAALFA